MSKTPTFKLDVGWDTHGRGQGVGALQTPVKFASHLAPPFSSFVAIALDPMKGK